MSRHPTWTILLLGLLFIALPKSMFGTEYGIIVDGKLTEHGAIVGRSTRAGDGKDDEAFILNGLYKFVYAGAGLRSPNARIHARLSMNKLDNTGAGVLVNGHWFTFDMDPGNKIGAAGPAFGDKAKIFAEAEGRIKPGAPFDVDILLEEGLLTVAINGEEVGEVQNFPTAMETVPSPDVGSVHKLGVITAIRSWRAGLKIYEFSVETDGEIVPLPEMQTTYHSHILYSDDHGETWHIGAPTGHGLNECEAVELENGDLMLNSRNHDVDEFHRGVSISKDGGQSFSSFHRDPALLEPRCQASIRRYRWTSGDEPGIILFSNPARKWRDFLMLRMSYDDGKTWPDARIIYPFTTAYSDIAVLPDGRIGVLFERDNHTKIDLAILPGLKVAGPR